MIRLIAAIDRQRGIAKCGCIPWKIPSDERFFTQQTKKYGGITLTGRVTFDTFKRPLKDRRNCVVTHSRKQIPGAEPVHAIPDFLHEHSEVWVVGGASIFAQTIARADELYLTIIDATFGCDRFFPEYLDEFVAASRSELQEENGFHFNYTVWRRKS